jgi:S-formylglutathione hydrolase FrmB
VKTKRQPLFWPSGICCLFFLLVVFKAFGQDTPCCDGDPALSYLLSPGSSQRFQYLVRYEVFFSKALGKEKGFFAILPQDFYQNPQAKYPVLFLLHGYNFHRRGFWWEIHSPEKASKILCEVKEEEYHWLLHEDIAIIAYAMMDSKTQTYGDLEKSLEGRFGELAKHGGLAKGDYTPKEIARSIVSHNLHPEGNLGDPFRALEKMIIVLPDGDNGFYTDENEGRRLFPETKDQKACDDFISGEAFNYSVFPFLYMKPGALGRHESYFLELLQYIDSRPPYSERVLGRRGLGGISMGGFGAMKLGLKYPHLFQSVSSQSGLLDIALLKNKWMLKMILPEFLEVFGHLEPGRLPTDSSLDLNHISANNPLILIKKRGISQLPQWIYFDYGEREKPQWVVEGNRNFEATVKERTHQIPAQPFNGKAGHNYQFWRSRSGNILKHHSDVFRRGLLGK